MNAGSGPQKNQGGLYKKYEVVKVGEETDPKARYFVLRLDTDAAARRAAWMYASLVQDFAEELARDLFEVLVRLDPELAEVMEWEFPRRV